MWLYVLEAQLTTVAHVYVRAYKIGQSTDPFTRTAGLRQRLVTDGYATMVAFRGAVRGTDAPYHTALRARRGRLPWLPADVAPTEWYIADDELDLIVQLTVGPIDRPSGFEAAPADPFADLAADETGLH
jgi:hypothetical protein